MNLSGVAKNQEQSRLEYTGQVDSDAISTSGGWFLVFLGHSEKKESLGHGHIMLKSK